MLLSFAISHGITGLWMDAICYFFAYKLLGKTFLKNAIFASFGFSMFYNIYEYFGYVIPSLDGYPISASVLGWLVVGLGVGIILISSYVVEKIHASKEKVAVV